ncbi:hypothetical protein GCM10020256_28960 [Streptomyces thermocoprophilus]
MRTWAHIGLYGTVSPGIGGSVRARRYARRTALLSGRPRSHAFREVLLAFREAPPAFPAFPEKDRLSGRDRPPPRPRPVRDEPLAPRVSPPWTPCPKGRATGPRHRPVGRKLRRPGPAGRRS